MSNTNQPIITAAPIQGADDAVTVTLNARAVALLTALINQQHADESDAEAKRLKHLASQVDPLSNARFS